MIKKLNQRIPANSLSYILIYGGIIILVVLSGIIPLNRYNANRSQDIKEIQARIDEQKGLGGLYQSLKIASGKKENHILPNPAKTRLSRQDVDKIQDIFRAEAGKSGLIIASLTPDVKTMASGSQNLLYNMTIKGEFANFQRLLVSLGALSYIDQFEDINIKQNGDSMEFRLKIWIALTN
ncbi:MAG: hypothetical protein FD159_1339 [Syntrophaceae bacterium]|nr:MAG: hypothetical protein FD159_1339 [Syntrophaceae bacterium]